MAYETLKSDIQSYVKQNGGGAITGDGLQSILLEIVNTLGTGFKYVGVATPSTSPGTPTENVFYIGGGGIYANFGSTIEVEAYQICVFAYNGSWSKSVINVGSSFDVEDDQAGEAVEFTFYSAETPDGRSIKINKDVSGLSNEPDEAISQWWAAQKERKINLIAGYTIDFDSLDASSPSSLGLFKAIQAGQIIDSYTNATSLIFGTDGGQSVTINKSQLPYTATANLINVKSASGTLSNVSIKVRGSLENMPSYININEIANHPAAYANAAAALADVPEIYRRKGTKVVYYDDDTQLWIEMLCIDDSLLPDWWTDVENNWVIEGPIKTKVITPTGGQQLKIAGEKRGNLDDVLNVNVWNEQIYEYESKADARAAVPTNKRKLGGVITYLIDGMWYTEQFIGSSTSTWTTTESDWKVLGPVSVSQNSQTGALLGKINVGSTEYDIKAEALDSTPTAEHTNGVTSGGVKTALDAQKVSVSQNTLSIGGNYAGEMGDVYDVTLHNSGATFASLEALLSDANLNTLIPLVVRKGGMNIKFVQSSDNKYVQYRLMATAWSTTVTDWQGVDNIPENKSENLVKSKGVKREINTTDFSVGTPISDSFNTTSGVAIAVKRDIVIPVDIKQGKKFFVQLKDDSNVLDNKCTVWALYKGDDDATLLGDVTITGLKAGREYTAAKDVDYITFSVTGARVVGSGLVELVVTNKTTSALALIQQEVNIRTNETASLFSTIQAQDFLIKDKIIKTILDDNEYQDITLTLAQDNYRVRGSGNVVAAINYGISNDIELNAGEILIFNTYTGSDVAIISELIGSTYSPVKVANVEGQQTFVLVANRYYKVRLCGVIGTSATDYSYWVVKCNPNWNLGGHFDINQKFYNNHNTRYLDITDGLVSTTETGTRYIYFTPVTKGEVVRLRASNSNTSKPITWGVFANVPANGSQADVYGSISEASVDEYINIYRNGYLGIGVNLGYHSNINLQHCGRLEEKVVYDSNRIVDTPKINASIFDNAILNIAYSVLSPHRGNSEPHFITAIYQGFNALKADMQLSKDGVIFLCHDSGYTLNGNGKVTTYNSENATLFHSVDSEEIEQLRFDKLYKGEEYGFCTLERFLYLCKYYNKVPFITLREQDWTGETIQEAYRLLKKFHLVDKVIINLFPATPYITSTIKSIAPELLLCDTEPVNIPLSEDAIKIAYNNGCDYIGIAGTQLASVTDALIEQCYLNNIRLLIHDISTAESYQNCVSAGAVGFQITTLDRIWDSVSNNNLVFVGSLPNSDPHNTGQLWNNAGIISISSGS